MAVRKIDTAEDFKSELDRCFPWLLEAFRFSNNQIAPEDILKGLVERDYQLWTTDHAACVTSLTEWDGKQVCCLFLIGGEKGMAMPEILAAHTELEEYARKHGCAGLLGIGRALWAKVLPTIGFNIISKGETDHVYFKEV